MKHFTRYLCLMVMMFSFVSVGVMAAQRDATATPSQGMENFINKWNSAGNNNHTTSQAFINELCDLLQLGRPACSGNEYRFSHFVTVGRPGGPLTSGCIDLYKNGSFALMFAVDENPSEQQPHMAAQKLGTFFASYLNEKPPFLLVAAAGRFIDVYADFTENANYAPFPAAEKNRILLEDLDKIEIRKLLQSIWLTPHALTGNADN